MDVPTVRFVLNRTAVARYGQHTNDVGEAIETAFAGARSGAFSTVAVPDGR